MFKNFWTTIENWMLPKETIIFDIPVVIRLEEVKDSIELHVTQEIHDVIVDGVTLDRLVRSRRYQLKLPNGYRVVKEVS